MELTAEILSKKPVAGTRTTEELMDTINAAYQEVSEALAALRVESPNKWVLI